MLELLAAVARSVLRQLFAIKIKIGIKTVEFVVGPKEIFELHTAAAKFHLVAIVKLSLAHQWQYQQHGQGYLYPKKIKPTMM